MKQKIQSPCCQYSYGLAVEICKRHQKYLCADRECECHYRHSKCVIEAIRQNNGPQMDQRDNVSQLPFIKQDELTVSKDLIKPFNSYASGKLLVLRNRKLRYEMFFDLSDEIEEICLFSCESDQWKMIFQEIQLLENLTHLSIDKCQDYQLFENLCHYLTQLTSLRIYCPQAETTNLNGLKNMKKLNHLQIRFKSLTDNLCDSIAEMTHLRKLNLTGLDKLHKVQTAISKNKDNLLFLNISENKFDEHQVKKIEQILHKHSPEGELINLPRDGWLRREEQLLKKQSSRQ